MIVVSIGPAQAAETLRTALAMGADRGILVKTDGLVEPLAVAKMLKGVVDAEQPGLVIMGKQAIDDDCNQTGQMLAALTGWAQGTFASKVELGDGKVAVTREVDGGLQTGRTEAAGDRHHRLAPQRAALRLAAQHHEGQEEADRREDAGRSRRRRRAAAESVEDRRAGRPQGRGEGQDGGRARRQAARRSGGDLTMATLLLGRSRQRPLERSCRARALTAALQLGAPVDVLVAGRDVAGAAAAAAKLSGVARVRVADAPLYEHGLAEPLAALIVALAPDYDGDPGRLEPLSPRTRCRARRRCST